MRRSAIFGMVLCVALALYAASDTISALLTNDPLAGCPDVAEMANRKGLPSYNFSPFLKTPHTEVKTLKTDCDQTAFIVELFSRVTREAATKTDQVKAWITYLQTTIYHSCEAPLDSAGIGIYSPIALLQKRGMQCGQVARIAVDGLLANGFDAQMVQLVSHQAAEVFLDGKWRYIEADILTGGEFIYDHNGEIASIEDIVKDRSLLNKTNPYKELYGWRNCQDGALIPDKYAEYKNDSVKRYAQVFDTADYKQEGGKTPYIIRKTATDLDKRNYMYGWNIYRFCSIDGRCFP